MLELRMKRWNFLTGADWSPPLAGSEDPGVPLPLMQWMVAPGSKAASRQMVLEGGGGFCKVRAGPNMSKCQQPWGVKIYLCPPHSQECVSYLVGDISVLLAFKIQIQGAWVIVSLQKCENKEQKENHVTNFVRKTWGGQSIKVFNVIKIVKDTKSITKTMMIVKVT